MNSVGPYQVGQPIQVEGRFHLESDDSEYDPDEVHLTVRDSNRVTTDYEYGDTEAAVQIVRVSEGLFTAELPATVRGRWYYRWWTPDEGATASRERAFDVEHARAVLTS